MTALETPWFLKTKTSDIGRLNQVFEDRLQRSVTELQWKRRKAILKIENQIEAIIQEYKQIRTDVDFSTDLDEHGKKIDPEVCRSKSTGDLPVKPLHKLRRPQSASGSGFTKQGKKMVARKKSKKKQDCDALAGSDAGDSELKNNKEITLEQISSKKPRRPLIKRQTTSENVLMPHLVKKEEKIEVNGEIVVNLDDNVSELQRIVGKADEALALPNIALSDAVAPKKKKKKKKKNHL